MNITIFTCKKGSIVFHLYKLLALWLNNYATRINIDIFDISSAICESGNKLAKEYGIDEAVKFHCKNILDISINTADEVVQSKHKDIYICWKRNVTACFAIKVYLCALHMGRQV